MLAARVAVRQPMSVDFLVSLAGVGLPGLEMMLLQDRLLSKDRGASPKEVARLMAYIKRFYEIAITHATREPRIAALKA